MFRKERLSIWIFILCCIALAMNAMAETSFSQKTYPKRPTESRLYDDNHLLDASETKLFDNLAEEFFQKTGIELTCVLTDNIPYSSERIEDYARETASTWNLGKESGEGIMIFVIQKRHAKNIFVTSAAQKIFKERDLERIMQKTLLPAFREYNYNEGILSLSYALAKKGADAKKVSLNIDESLYKLSQNKTSSLMILFIFFLTLMAKFSGGRGNGILWFLFGGAIKNKKKDETEKTGFGGGFGSSPSGFGGGFGGGLGGGFGSAMSRYGKRDSW